MLRKKDSTDLPRLELERALKRADAGDRSLADKIGEAARAAGADVLLMLPAPAGGMSAVVRLADRKADRFLEIRASDAGLSVLEGKEIDPRLLALARASVDVLQRIGADEKLRAPLSEPAK